MDIKKGLKTAFGIVGTALYGTALAAIWVLKQPPKIVKFVLNNKFKSLLAAAAIYFGYRQVKETVRYNRDVDNELNRIRAEERMKEQARQAREQQIAEFKAQQAATQSQTNTTRVAAKPAKQSTPVATTNAPAPAATNAPAKPVKKLHPMQVATKQVITEPVKTNETEAAKAPAPTSKAVQEAQKLTKEAVEVAAQNAFVTSPTMDMSARSGDRAAPAGTRFRYLLNKGAKDNGATDVGDNTILICSQKDPKNYAVLYLGFRNVPKGGPTAYMMYYTSIQTRTGYLPFIGGFNVQFTEVPGMRMGLTLNEKGMAITNFQRKSPVINVTRNSGRTLLQVDENGGLHHVYDPQVVEQIFAQTDVSQTAEIRRQKFNLYDDSGRSHRTQGSRQVPRPGVDRL